MNPPASSPSPLRALYLEDSPLDAELVQEALTHGDFALEIDVAPDRAAFVTLLAGPAYDVILADFSLPGLDAHEALGLARGATPETPFVCISGTISEAATVELLESGADDCVLKDHLARLPFAVRRAIDDRARQRALRESEALYRSILNASPDDISVTDLEGRLRIASPAAVAVFGYQREQEMLGRLLTDFLVPEDRERAQANIARMIEGELWGPDEYRGLRADGGSMPIEANGEFIRDAAGRPTGMVFVIRDLTGRKQAEETLRERGRMLDTLMGNVPGLVYRCANDAAWTVLFASAGCEELTGYPPPALVGSAVVSYADLVYPGDYAKLWDDIQAGIDAGVPWTSTYRIVTAAGEVRWVRERGVAVTGDDDNVLFLEGFIQDVTDRHLAESRLHAAAEEWRRTFDAMPDSVAVLDRDGRVLRCNRATTELTGRGFEDIIGRPCHEIFHNTQDFHPSCPQRRAFESRRPESSVFQQDGMWLRVTFEPDVDESGQVVGGVHVVSDVTPLKASEHQLRESVVKQERITEGVIAALSRSVEVRDPYTAGHERRVSQLATAIARRMGLGEDLAKRVHVAGMLHDVGKIVVPAEILNKPGRLTEVEFALIKGHPQTAYSILEAIEFDFPMADIVSQHHERLDGSGYPAGIAGDEILLEARILAVADVAEAMISHRPYRPALPLDAAIDELTTGAGTCYDAAACDAAVQILRDPGFEFVE